MTKKPKNQKEVLARIKERMAEKAKETPTYDDWQYYRFEVDVCDVYLDDEAYRVPSYIGELIQNIVEDSNEKNEMITLGDVSFRAYLVKKLYFKKERFSSMCDWGKRMLLEREPKLFAELENNFSPALKEYLRQIKGKHNNKVKALPKPETWGVE